MDQLIWLGNWPSNLTKQLERATQQVSWLSNPSMIASNLSRMRLNRMRLSRMQSSRMQLNKLPTRATQLSNLPTRATWLSNLSSKQPANKQPNGATWAEQLERVTQLGNLKSNSSTMQQSTMWLNIMQLSNASKQHKQTIGTSNTIK